MTDRDKPFEVFVDLIISGDNVSPDELTDLLGVAPTKVEIKGQRKSARIETYYERSRWLYRNASSSEKEIPELMDSFIDTFSEKTDELNRIASQDMDICVFLAIYKHEYWPGVNFFKKHVSFIKDIGARLELDLY